MAWRGLVSNSHAGFGPLSVALADHALTLMETIMADLKLESLSPTAVRCVLTSASFLLFLSFILSDVLCSKQFGGKF